MSERRKSEVSFQVHEWRLKELVDRKEAFVCAACLDVFSRIDHKDVLMRSTATGSDVTLCKDCAHRLLADGAVMKIPNLLYDVDAF